MLVGHQSSPDGGRSRDEGGPQEEAAQRAGVRVG